MNNTRHNNNNNNNNNNIPVHFSALLGFQPTHGNNTKRWTLTNQSKPKLVFSGMINPLKSFFALNDWNKEFRFWMSTPTRKLMTQYMFAKNQNNEIKKNSALNLLWKTYPSGRHPLTSRNTLTKNAFQRKLDSYLYDRPGIVTDLRSSYSPNVNYSSNYLSKAKKSRNAKNNMFMFKPMNFSFSNIHTRGVILDHKRTIC